MAKVSIDTDNFRWIVPFFQKKNVVDHFERSFWAVWVLQLAECHCPGPTFPGFIGLPGLCGRPVGGVCALLAALWLARPSQPSNKQHARPAGNFYHSSQKVGQGHKFPKTCVTPRGVVGFRELVGGWCCWTPPPPLGMGCVMGTVRPNARLGNFSRVFGGFWEALGE